MVSNVAANQGALNCPNCGAAAAPDSIRCEYCRSTLVAGACSSCFGAVFVGMPHCPWCGSDAPAPRSGESICLKCPRCEIDLTRVSSGNCEWCECRECGGLWVEKGAFQEICTREEEQEAVLSFKSTKQDAPSSAGRKPERAYIPCPECGKLMNRSNFAGCSGVILDWCRQHGSWFDRSELQRIVAFIRDGGLRKSRQREKTKLEEEKSDLRRKRLELAVMERRGGEDSSFGLGLSGNSDALWDLFSVVSRHSKT